MLLLTLRHDADNRGNAVGPYDADGRQHHATGRDDAARRDHASESLRFDHIYDCSFFWRRYWRDRRWGRRAHRAGRRQRADSYAVSGGFVLHAVPIHLAKNQRSAGMVKLCAPDSHYEPDHAGHSDLARLGDDCADSRH